MRFEMAVLVIVFAPLDRWVEQKSYGWPDFGKTLAISAALFIMGVILEKIRERGRVEERRFLWEVIRWDFRN